MHTEEPVILNYFFNDKNNNYPILEKMVNSLVIDGYSYPWFTTLLPMTPLITIELDQDDEGYYDFDNHVYHEGYYDITDNVNLDIDNEFQFYLYDITAKLFSYSLLDASLEYEVAECIIFDFENLAPRRGVSLDWNLDGDCT